MTQVVQAKCPGCQKLLRIPSDWARQAFRCKHCGMVLRPRQKPSPAPATTPVQATPAPALSPPPLPARVAIVESPPSNASSFPSAPENGPIIRSPYQRPARGLWWKIGIPAIVLCTLTAAVGFFVVAPRLLALRTEILNPDDPAS